MVGSEPQTLRAMAIAMEIAAWTAILPLSLVSFASGVAQSLWSEWGLLRHH